MEIFRKGGSDPIHNFATHFFCVAKLWNFGLKGGGEGGSITLIHFLQKSSFKYGHFKCFWKVLFFPFFCYQNQMCSNGSITPENKGGGQTPYGRFPEVSPFF